MSKQVLAEKVSQLLNVAVDKVLAMLDSESATYSQPHPGSTWVTVLNGTWLTFDGILLSAYYHPSKTHSATTVGKLGTKKSRANAGQWAISYQKRGAYGNKAFYNIQD